MKRLPDYEKRSKKAKELCEDDVALKALRDRVYKEIYNGLPQSVQVIKNLRTSEDDNIKLKAAKEHLLLAGIGQQKIEIGGTVNFRPFSAGGDNE